MKRLPQVLYPKTFISQNRNSEVERVDEFGGCTVNEQ